MIWQVIGLVTLGAVALSECATRLFHAAGAARASRAAVYVPILFIEAVLLFAMLERRAPLFGRVYWKGTPEGREVALTFDDGPTEPYTAQILDVLRARNVRATFFVLGRRAESLPDVLARAAAEGHEIGNHGYDHSVLPLRGPAFSRQQIERTSDIVERTCGRRPTLFRASHGWRSPWLNRVASQAGCEVVGWTLGVWDTDRPGADVIRQRVLRGVEPGCILLLHDGRGVEARADAGQVVEALPGIIDGLHREGYKLVTVSDMMKNAAARNR